VGDVFDARFFDHAPVPLLMIAGTSDGMVEYAANALPIPERVRGGGLVTIEGGTHLGFSQIASGLMRVLGNPDRVGCSLGDTSDPAPENPFTGLFGTPEQGLLEVTAYPTPCATRFEGVMSAGQQQMLTRLAVRSFFESHFADSADARASHAVFLTRTFPAEVPEVSYTASRR
jgi:hypothetical protein